MSGGTRVITFYKRYWRTAFDIALLVLTVFLIMWVFSKLYQIAAPIFLALIIFAIIEPLAKFLNKHHIKKSIATAISMCLFIVIILGVSFGAGVIFIKQITGFADKIPHYAQVLQRQIVMSAEQLQDQYGDKIPQEVIDKTKEYTTIATEKGAQLVTWILGKLLGMLSSISTFLFQFLIAMILAYFLSLEINSWKKLARRKTPRTFKIAFLFLKENVLKGIFTYIKAQMKLVTITFVLVLTGLLILRVDNAFFVAVLTAVFDILPLLGVASLFIPWIIYLFIVGQTTIAIWITVLMVIILLVRQVLEPKITGDSLGVSAFTTLAFMVVSLSLFGVAGLILSPVLIITIKALIDQGYLQRWIRLPEEEFTVHEEGADEN